MVIAFLFLFFLMLENMFLPALIGPRTILISHIFLLSIFVFGTRRTLMIVQALLLSLAEEFFLGLKLGTITAPMLATGVLYFWVNHFIELRTSLREGGGLRTMLLAGGVLSVMFYIYSMLYILLDASFNWPHAWENFKPLLSYGIAINAFVWGCVSSAIWKYVLQPK